MDKKGRKPIPVFVIEEHFTFLEIEAGDRNRYRRDDEDEWTPYDIAAEIFDEYFTLGKREWREKAKEFGKKNIEE
ncbi:hypothetical protein KAR91_22220 [Candidatus Pacearchaeota archaeon]|nr:hypothetical protein [Candidatus Pacearchaeota archaeon]